MSVTAARGFLASGVACGLKDGGVLDLAMVACEQPPAAAAATFTTNGAAAAPVQLSRTHLAANQGRAAAVILNSGCANAATGAPGMQAAQLTTAEAAQALGVETSEILVCSTGLIGIPLAVERIVSAIPGLVKGLGATSDDGARAARAIMTTDTHPKQVTIEGSGFTVGGMAKGAGMIAPNMATMLSVLTTDAAASPEVLATALRQCVEHSFNSLIVDGSMSTNDTVILLSSGLAGPVDPVALGEALGAACADLVEQMAEDAEGTTRVAAIRVVGAESEGDARRAGRQVALSLLVKTSLFGSDPYWGRIVSELGASGAAFDLDRVRVDYGGVTVCAGGVDVPHDDDAVRAYLHLPRVEILCDLGLGNAEATTLTTDLGHGYIDENMRTS